ncbi:MAG: hypothetical protein ACRDOK_21225 [Streptosporangiaceae bacterium]
MLSEFRARLVAGSLEARILEALPGRLKGLGLVAAGGPQRTDSTRVFLAEYGWTASMGAFLEVVAARIQAHATSLRGLAARDPLFARIVAQGGADNLDTALAELAHVT